MTTCTLRIELTMARGALARVIRLIEHRSVRVVDIRVCTIEDHAVVELTVEGRLPAAAFAAQFRKLYDVVDARLIAGAAPESTSAAGEKPPRRQP